MKLNNVIRKAYNAFFRKFLPKKISVHNGVPVNDHARLFDLSEEFPKYEEALISAIRQQVREGDRVVIIGGGMGVSTVAAAETTGRSGVVETYEGSTDQFEILKNTICLNKQWEEYINLSHQVVGDFSEYSSNTYGNIGGADIINPSALPEADVLVLDCEGAEVSILANMSISPRIIIVETHGFLGSSEEIVKDTLINNEYYIINRGLELESKGVFVLTAEQRD